MMTLRHSCPVMVCAVNWPTQTKKHSSKYNTRTHLTLFEQQSGKSIKLTILCDWIIVSLFAAGLWIVHLLLLFLLLSNYHLHYHHHLNTQIVLHNCTTNNYYWTKENTKSIHQFLKNCVVDESSTKSTKYASTHNSQNHKTILFTSTSWKCVYFFVVCAVFPTRRASQKCEVCSVEFLMMPRPPQSHILTHKWRGRHELNKISCYISRVLLIVFT